VREWRWLALILALQFAPPALWLRAGEAAVAAPATTASEKCLAEAQRILTTFKTSEYSHTTSVDEDSGKYNVDCSGLVCVILKKTAPLALKEVPKVHGKSRPLAADFHDAFERAPSVKTDKKWLRIDRLADARPGDLIAWRRAEITPGEDTGHIVIVAEAPIKEDDGQFRVTLIDSTKTAHANDTRKEDANGVGRGTMWFAVDENGKATGYRWKARTGKLNSNRIAVARVVEKP
jgi:hypothetical protein